MDGKPCKRFNFLAGCYRTYNNKNKILYRDSVLHQPHGGNDPAAHVRTSIHTTKYKGARCAKALRDGHE